LSEILEKKTLGPQINLIKLKVPHIVKKAKPGQFVILRTHERGERIPMSIADLDTENGILTIIFQEVGKSTAELATYKTKDVLSDVIGPLGKQTPIENYGTSVCVGGGIGIAPVHPIAKALKACGNRVISIIGARSKELLFMEKEMKKTSDELLVTTDDGSYGAHGLVSEPLAEMLKNKQKIDFVMAIGPVPMMRAACSVTRPYGVKTMVSLNPIMIDGTGMCGVCRVSVGGETKFACVDGPDFDGHQVDFEELQRRLRMFLKDEKIAMERYLSLLGEK